MIACEDWRASPAALIASLLEAEAAVWQRELAWDVTGAWRVIEPARAAGHLPGFIARDGRSVAGWTSFLLHQDCLQVMALLGRDGQVIRQLIEAILGSPEAARASSVIFCIRGASPVLGDALVEHGLRVEPYRYLAAPLGSQSDIPSGFRSWNHDEESMAALCARGYADSIDVRAFAPGGTAAEWREYVSGLLSGPGCGVFQAAWSPVAPGSPDGTLAGAAVVTQIAPEVAHLAQMVIDPDREGRGLGRRIVEAAMRAAASGGCRMMTLLVARSNARASRLYERLGFTDRGVFVVATSPQPRMSTSFALATGGASTRR